MDNKEEFERLTNTFLTAEKEVEQIVAKLKDIQLQLKEAMKLKNQSYKQLVDHLKGAGKAPEQPPIEGDDKKVKVKRAPKKKEQEKLNTRE